MRLYRALKPSSRTSEIYLTRPRRINLFDFFILIDYKFVFMDNSNFEIEEELVSINQVKNIQKNENMKVI